MREDGHKGYNCGSTPKATSAGSRARLFFACSVRLSCPAENTRTSTTCPPAHFRWFSCGATKVGQAGKAIVAWARVGGGEGEEEERKRKRVKERRSARRGSGGGAKEMWGRPGRCSFSPPRLLSRLRSGTAARSRALPAHRLWLLPGARLQALVGTHVHQARDDRGPPAPPLLLHALPHLPS